MQFTLAVQDGPSLLISTAADGLTVESSIFVGGHTDSMGITGFTSGASDTITIRNCTFKNTDTAGSSEGVHTGGSFSGTIDVINCTFYNIDAGIEIGTGTINSRNNALFGNDNDHNGAAITITNCATEEGAGEGTNGVAITQTADNYAALVTDAPNGDYSLTDSSSELHNAGSATYAPADDIIDTVRPQDSTDDIGAFELIVAAGAFPQVIIINGL